PVPGTPYYLSMAQELKEQKNHFYTDRAGVLAGQVGQAWVTLSDTGFYWDFTPVPPVLPSPPGDPGSPDGQLNVDAIAADIDREILINCQVYRVIRIEAGTFDGTVYAPDSTHTKWTIFLDRPVDAKDCDSCEELPANDPFTNVKFQMGALFVGSPFEVVVPTNLIFLRNAADAPVASDCLPCYPLDNCTE
ncbi:MAG TPA: hypothetical protein VK826_10340, partial [Bacteroidia bacterium]|nr:hypothetical protein [Bacteroidia bacterium]